MGKFIITESERIEILKLHNDYKKSLVSEQDTKFIIPPTFPQTESELNTFSLPFKNEAVNELKNEAIKQKIISYVIPKYIKKYGENQVITWIMEELTPYVEKLKLIYGDNSDPKRLGTFSDDGQTGPILDINSEGIVNNAKERGSDSLETLKKVIRHELRHAIYRSIYDTNLTSLPTEFFVGDSWNKLPTSPTKIKGDRYAYDDVAYDYRYSPDETMARLKEFREVLGITSDQNISPDEFKKIFESKFKTIFDKYPSVSEEELKTIQQQSKFEKLNPLSLFTRELNKAIFNTGQMNLKYWYKGSYETFTNEFKKYFVDVQWIVSEILTYKIEDKYFYIDYNFLSTMQNYFVSVEKGDTKNIG
jgi:hypothetical protein